MGHVGFNPFLQRNSEPSEDSIDERRNKERGVEVKDQRKKAHLSDSDTSECCQCWKNNVLSNNKAKTIGWSVGVAVTGC